MFSYDISGQVKQGSQKGLTGSFPAKKDFIKMKLPLGQDFETWAEDFHPKKVYHVAQHAKNASDENDGS